MRRSMIGLTVLALIASSAYVVLAGGKGGSCSSGSQANAGGSCSSSSQANAGGASAGQSAASCAAPGGKIAGHFDPAMSGVCRYACATRLKYKNADVAAQPGAKVGKLTQCPVSGVVFVADAGRPRVRIAGAEYVTCCDRCAVKLKKDLRRYLKA